MDRPHAQSTRRDFVDHQSIQRNQVLLIIITILVQFHLPYLSLSPARAAAMSTEDGLESVGFGEQGAETDDFSFNERGIPYLNDETGDSSPKSDIKPRLLGIHVEVPGSTPRRATALGVGSGSARTIVVTAYSSTKDQTDSSPCITANGFNVCRHGAEDVIAANFLPFGTRVQFPDHFGDREFIVRDRMNARYSNRVDIWMKSRGAAKQFGIKRLKMVVLSDDVPEKDAKDTQVAVNF
ncbi:3D domain-containing protein [Candidatus Uhrbacteria bacterium]|nr:3D domain-containing protein [Candidatus Uhrbacteria bacterium]